MSLQALELEGNEKKGALECRADEWPVQAGSGMVSAWRQSWEAGAVQQDLVAQRELSHGRDDQGSKG